MAERGAQIAHSIEVEGQRGTKVNLRCLLSKNFKKDHENITAQKGSATPFLPYSLSRFLT